MKPLKRILVPLDESDHCRSAVRMACHIAKQCDACVTGLSVFSPALVRSSIAPVAYYDFPTISGEIEDAIAHHREALHETQHWFDEYCRKQGVKHDCELEKTEVPLDGVLAYAKLHDLVVTGLRYQFAKELGGEESSSLIELLHHSVTPVLAVPKEVSLDLPKVTVAYDGTLASVRALKDFVSMDEVFPKMDVSVVSAHKKEKNACFHVEAAANFLQHHNVGQSVSKCPKVGKLAAKDILQDDVPDLVVAGIHSRNIVKDLVVGSFTYDLINSEKTAVFLSH